VIRVHKITFTAEGVEIDYSHSGENQRARVTMSRRITLWYDMAPEDIETLRAMAANLTSYAEEFALELLGEDQ
jgi:hypothetical protein